MIDSNEKKNRKRKKLRTFFTLLVVFFPPFWCRLPAKHTDSHICTFVYIDILARMIFLPFLILSCLWVYIFSLKYIYVKLVLHALYTLYVVLLFIKGKKDSHATSAIPIVRPYSNKNVGGMSFTWVYLLIAHRSISMHLAWFEKFNYIKDLHSDCVDITDWLPWNDLFYHLHCFSTKTLTHA